MRTMPRDREQDKLCTLTETQMLLLYRDCSRCTKQQNPLLGVHQFSFGGIDAECMNIEFLGLLDKDSQPAY